MVPLLSVCAAYSFLIMMFNVPLPGGTTGHAVGMGVTAIVLGPWASILAISVALLIQAVFFGDGGITAYGANCFNMAIVGSLVAYFVYRVLAGKTAANSPRRPIAAAIAGYIAINAAAFCASIEFGIQPMFFHDASGAPLYAPYPLGIAVPAMVLGHLAFAGITEAILAGGVMAWLQHSNIELVEGSIPKESTATPGGWRLTRPFWIGIAALMIATPLGLLAAGSAWGEWGVEDFAKPEVRQQMAAASANVAPPEAAPSGMERLASIWTAPFPDYAPSFLKSQQLGYILSAMIGTGLLILTGLVGERLMRYRKSEAKPTLVS
jgi:cobalt/nickel transport system permease protein